MIDQPTLTMKTITKPTNHTENGESATMKEEPGINTGALTITTMRMEMINRTTRKSTLLGGVSIFHIIDKERTV